MDTETTFKQPVKRKPGRPRTRSPQLPYPKHIIHAVEKMALAQANSHLIAEALRIDFETFERDFKDICRAKRAEGKRAVLERQYSGALANGKGAVTERIWWGKQHLDQRDQQEVHGDNLRPLKVVIFAPQITGSAVPHALPISSPALPTTEQIAQLTSAPQPEQTHNP